MAASASAGLGTSSSVADIPMEREDSSADGDVVDPSLDYDQPPATQPLAMQLLATPPVTQLLAMQHPAMPPATQLPVMPPATQLLAMPPATQLPTMPPATQLLAMPPATQLPAMLPAVVWPAETNLVFAPGSTRLALMLQSLPLRAVIRDAIENARAFLLFESSFPEAVNIPAAMKRCFTDAAAGSQNPMAPYIFARLNQEDEYAEHLGHLVSVSQDQVLRY